MRFLGSDVELDALVSRFENSFDAIIMDAYNAGFSSCNRNIDEMYRRAKSAIVQHIDLEAVKEQNPFIDLLLLYVKSNEEYKIEEPGLEGA